MKDEQILTQAIEKAVENGYRDNGMRNEQCFNTMNMPVYKNIFYQIIFSHSFAKAFFGGEWDNNLMSMVTKEQPLKYIEKFIDKE